MAVQLSVIALKSGSDCNVVRLHVNGKLSKEDYELFGLKFERLIAQHGKIRVLFDMQDFHGWTAGALWEDVQFDRKHFKDIDRIAMIGQSSWEHGMAIFCRPFTFAKIRYFDQSEADQAEQWITEN